MAKGLEDTTFYNFNRLNFPLNEVGGNPGSFGTRRRRFSSAQFGKSRAMATLAFGHRNS